MFIGRWYDRHRSTPTTARHIRDRGMTRRGLMALLAMAPTALLSGCGGSSTVRYRLTLQVETPEGPKTGSGVIEHAARWNDGITRGLGAGAGLAVGTRGEAIITDLGARGLLLCLLTRDEARAGSADDFLLPDVFPFDKWDGSQKDYAAYLGRLDARKPVGNAPLENLPMLARLRDPQDPGTAERVDPTNLAATFGAGVRLVRVTVQITDDPLPPPTIENKLPWIRTLQGSIGNTLGLRLGILHALHQINSGSFRLGPPPPGFR
jgi:hypothetical protein